MKFISVLSEQNSVEIPISALTNCLEMDARLEIKLIISEYYVRFNKATIGNMAVSFRWRKVSFPIKEKKLKNTFWIAEKIISVELSAPKQ